MHCVVFIGGILVGKLAISICIVTSHRPSRIGLCAYTTNESATRQRARTTPSIDFIESPSTYEGFVEAFFGRFEVPLESSPGFAFNTGTGASPFGKGPAWHQSLHKVKGDAYGRRRDRR